jgi:hypothetical protein
MTAESECPVNFGQPGTMSTNSTSPADVAALFHFLEETDYGPLLATVLVTFALWGMLYIQVYSYYTGETSKADKAYMKLMVGVTFILESFFTFLFAHITYYYMVYNFGNPSQLSAHPWSLNLVFVTKGLQMFIIRCLFLRRVFVLSERNWIIAAVILLCSGLDFASGIAFTIQFFGFGLILSYPHSLYVTVYIAQAGGLSADVSLAAALCYYLYKSRTGFKRTNSIVRVFIVYTINSTVIVVLMALISTILFLTTGNSFYDFPFLAAQSKLYIIAYMTTLNGREQLRRDEGPQSVPMSSFTTPSTQVQSGGETAFTSEKSNLSNIRLATTVQTYVV